MKSSLFRLALLFSPLAHAAEKPNVLFIVIDDLNDWIGCMNGHPQALTPNIDRLAARGVLFTNAHCASAACKPSRAAVFSGMTSDKTDDLDDLAEMGKLRALEADTAGLHKTVITNNQWEKAIEGYLACITYIDHEVGRVLDELDRSPHKDHTTIVLWSDHGWHLGEKQHWGKWTGWERSTRVPLIIVPPKNQAGKFARPGSTCEQPVGLIDLYPTLTELCRVPAPKNLSGHSLVPLLKNPAMETKRKLVTTFNPGNLSVRTKQWRYIRYEDGSRELYDMKNDPNEWTNLAGEPEHKKLIEDFESEIE